jgi:hypothetical protein
MNASISETIRRLLQLETTPMASACSTDRIGPTCPLGPTRPQAATDLASRCSTQPGTRPHQGPTPRGQRTRHTHAFTEHRDANAHTHTYAHTNTQQHARRLADLGTVRQNAGEPVVRFGCIVRPLTRLLRGPGGEHRPGALPQPRLPWGFSGGGRGAVPGGRGARGSSGGGGRA